MFSEEYLARGKDGGRDAAASLSAAIKDHLQSYNANLPGQVDGKIGVSSRGSRSQRIISPQILCTVYVNRMGLSNTLVSSKICTAQKLSDFIIGFNQASPLFTVVDVGEGKEAADTKLRGKMSSSFNDHF